MASARLAQLLEQRKATKAISSLFGEKRRILSPSNTTISSIARKTITAELEAMVNKYNDGLIGNDEMRTFLAKTKDNSTLTSLEKVDLEDQIRDFDSKIFKDKLEANFRGAPENSLAQAQAASALANYYQTRASTMVEGTPAHSQATENFAVWNQKGMDIQENVKTLARRNQRYVLEAKVNEMPTNSSERALAKANMWKELYDQAAADEDATEANKYASYYQQEITKANELADREFEREEKESYQQEKGALTNIINTMADQYHDNKISAMEFANQLEAVNQRAVELGDVSLQLAVNRWSDKLAKDIEKGVKRGTIGNLPTVTGRGGKGGGAQTNWDKQDFDYSDNLRLAQDDFKAGKSTPEEYLQDIAYNVQERAGYLSERIQTIESIARENPNTKVTYNGKKQKAEDILDNLYEEWDSLEEQAGAANSGNFALLEVAPSEGTELGKGKSKVTYRIVDPRTFEEGTVVADDQGILHELQSKKIWLTPEQMRNDVINGVYTSPENPEDSGFVSQDSSGRVFYTPKGKQMYRTYLPGLNTYEEYEYEQGKPAKSAEAVQTEAEMVWEEQAKAKETQLKAPIVPVEPTAIEKAKEVGTRIVSAVAPIKEKLEAISPTKAITEKAVSIVQPTVVKAVKAVLPPAPEFKPLEQARIPEGVKIDMPSVQLPTAVTPTQPKLQLAGGQTTPLQSLYKQPIKLPASFAPPPPPQPTFEQRLWSNLKGLATKLWPF